MVMKYRLRWPVKRRGRLAVGYPNAGNDGLALLKQIKQRRTSMLPVIIMTARIPI